MKKFKYTLLLIGGLSILGCSDLEESPISQLSPESYLSSLSLTEVEGYVNGAYSHMMHRNFLSREMAQALEFRSDMTAIGNTPAQERIDHDDFTVLSNNGLISVYWPKVYQIIGGANEAIKAGKLVSVDDEAVKNEVIARARFARAFAYFHLVRQFGAIPYLDDTTLLADAAIAPRTPVDEVYTHIIEDFEYAKEWLPNTRASRALPTKAAASSYLALVYLTMGQFDSANFQKAYDEAKEVIDNKGIYNLALEPDYQDLFNADKVDDSKEPIFVLDFTGVSNGDQGRDYQAAFQGIRSDQQNVNIRGGGWSVQVPSQKVYDSWDNADYRKKVNFDATAIFNAKPPATGTVTEPYTVFESYDSNGRNRPHIAKYTRFSGVCQDGNGRGSNSNYMMIRYAEVLLIAAEALNEVTPGTAEATGYLNEVRTRARTVAGVPEASTVPANYTYVTQEAFRTMVLEDRRLELCFEFSRWYDIVRRKMADAPYNVFGANGLEVRPNFDPSRDYLLPLPNDDMLRNPNLLPNNPGY